MIQIGWRVNSELLIIVGCTVAGGAIGGIRGFQMVSSGGYGSSSAMRSVIGGVIIGVVLGLLIVELKDLNLW